MHCGTGYEFIYEDTDIYNNIHTAVHRALIENVDVLNVHPFSHFICEKRINKPLQRQHSGELFIQRRKNTVSSITNYD